MAWSAKPSGAYGIDSPEAQGNMTEFFSYFSTIGYTVEAVAGMLGNVYAESGLNPWRYQGDSLSGAGYGLFQFTPKSGWLSASAEISSLDGYAPNRSVTSVTAGADPRDGYAQIQAIGRDLLGKWTTACWRSYWDKTEYAELYQASRGIVDTYGSGGRLHQDEFAGINNLYDATFAFLACYEGPAVPSIDRRYGYAQTAYEYLSGQEPPHPPEPVRRKGMPVWMMVRRF